MTDLPIIFSGPMVRALLDGHKAMTRRLAWGKPIFSLKAQAGWRRVERGTDIYNRPSPWQRVKPGDRLWVRETWVAAADGVWTAGDVTRARGIVPMEIIYSADGPKPHGWFSPIHMPRWASRITLIVTATKIERLQEINEADAMAEGVERAIAGSEMWGGITRTIMNFRTGFVRIWGGLHGTDSWLSNPEVVALTFRVIKANIDRAEGEAA